MKTLLVLLLTMLGCGGSAPSSEGGLPEGAFWCDEAHSRWCAVGSTCLPSGSCWEAEQARDTVDAGCNAVACQALADDSLYGSRSTCSGWCASACQASCDGDLELVAEAEAKAKAAGCGPCAY